MLRGPSGLAEGRLHQAFLIIERGSRCACGIGLERNTVMHVVLVTLVGMQSGACALLSLCV